MYKSQIFLLQNLSSLFISRTMYQSEISECACSWRGLLYVPSIMCLFQCLQWEALCSSEYISIVSTCLFSTFPLVQDSHFWLAFITTSGVKSQVCWVYSQREGWGQGCSWAQSERKRRLGEGSVSDECRFICLLSSVPRCWTIFYLLSPPPTTVLYLASLFCLVCKCVHTTWGSDLSSWLICHPH